MEKLLDKLLENNFAIAFTIVVSSCLLLSGGSLVYVSDRSLFIDLDLFKLIFMSLTPSSIIFSIIFIMSIGKGIGDDSNTKRVVISAVLTAIYNFMWAYFIFVGIANADSYIHFIAIGFVTAFTIVSVTFVKDSKRNT